MTTSNWFTAVLAAVAAAVPAALPFVPPPYNAIAVAGVSFLGMLWHLFTPVPKS